MKLYIKYIKLYKIHKLFFILNPLLGTQKWLKFLFPISCYVQGAMPNFWYIVSNETDIASAVLEHTLHAFGVEVKMGDR